MKTTVSEEVSFKNEAFWREHTEEGGGAMRP